MHPLVRRDLLPLGQLDHMHRWHVPALATGPAFQSRFYFSDRRVALPADRIGRLSWRPLSFAPVGCWPVADISGHFLSWLAQVPYA